MRSAIRVLQAADFFQHQPLEPAGVLPADLREIFNQARERSALKVFQQALSSSVDLLLLTGTLAHFDEEPRLSCFLFEQFRRLAKENIQIAWASAADESLPDWATQSVVHRIHPGEELFLSSLRSGAELVIIWPENGQPIPRNQAKHLVIGIQHSTDGMGVEYIYNGELAARHRAMPIQNDGPEDQSSCGMWLTQLGLIAEPVSERLATATVEWTTSTIELHADTSRVELLREMERRLDELSRRQTADLQLVSWTLTGKGPLWPSLINDRFCSDLLQSVRNLVRTEKRLWNWKIDLNPSTSQVEFWQKQSDAFALAQRIQNELTPEEMAAVFGTGVIPGHDLPHHDAIIQPHRIRTRLAQSLLHPGAEYTTNQD